MSSILLLQGPFISSLALLLSAHYRGKQRFLQSMHVKRAWIWPSSQGVTALTNAVWAEPCVNYSIPENFEYHPEILGDIPPKNSKFLKNVTLLLCVSWKIPKVFRFPAKSSDSQKNFVFLLKQPFLELTPPVSSTNSQPSMMPELLILRTVYSSSDWKCWWKQKLKYVHKSMYGSRTVVLINKHTNHEVKG